MWRSVVMAAALMPAIVTAAATNTDAAWIKAGEAARVRVEQERAARTSHPSRSGSSLAASSVGALAQEEPGAGRPTA